MVRKAPGWNPMRSILILRMYPMEVARSEVEAEAEPTLAGWAGFWKEEPGITDIRMVLTREIPGCK